MDDPNLQSATELAKRYAALGVRTFPIFKKAPAIKKREGQGYTYEHASDDESQIEALFDKARRLLGPDAELGVGVVPGPKYIVLDVDVADGKRGVEQLEELEREFAPLDTPVKARTQSGGLHLWLLNPDPESVVGSRSLAQHIDVRSGSGYVVAPGTSTSWGTWDWDGPSLFENKPPACPQWVLDRLADKNGHQKHEPDIDLVQMSDDDPRLTSQLRERLAEAPMPEGKRSGQTWAVLGMCRRAGLSREETAWLLAKRHQPTIERAKSRGGPEALATSEVERFWAKQDVRPTSGPWTPTKLGDFIRNPRPPLEPYGNLGMLYEGKNVLIFGPPESGKSTVAANEVVWHIKRGRPVFYFDEDAGPEDVAARLLALGADADDLDEHLHYYEPADRKMITEVEKVHQLVGPYSDSGGLVVFDAKADFLASEGLPENNDNNLRFLGAVVLPLSRMGFTTLTIDHVTIAASGSSSRHDYARNGLSTAGRVDLAWRCDANPHFDRTRDGAITLRCTKDRGGSIGRGTEIKIDVSTGDGAIALTTGDRLGPDEAKLVQEQQRAALRSKPTKAEEGTLDIMKAEPEKWWTKREVGDRRGCRVQSLPMDALVEKGYVEQRRDGNRNVFRVTQRVTEDSVMFPGGGPAGGQSELTS